MATVTDVETDLPPTRSQSPDTLLAALMEQQEDDESESGEEVDEDEVNPAEMNLIELILNSEWRHCMLRIESSPKEAKLKQIVMLNHVQTKGYPLHLAVTMKPPKHVVEALISANPDAIKSREETWGRLPLHLACIFTASAQVLKVLMDSYDESLRITDKAEGRLPVHYGCLYGSPFEISLLVSAEQRALVFKDGSGKTPLDLAHESKNPHKQAILKRLGDRTRLVTEAMIERRRRQKEQRQQEQESENDEKQIFKTRTEEGGDGHSEITNGHGPTGVPSTYNDMTSDGGDSADDTYKSWKNSKTDDDEESSSPVKPVAKKKRSKKKKSSHSHRKKKSSGKKKSSRKKSESKSVDDDQDTPKLANTNRSLSEHLKRGANEKNLVRLYLTNNMSSSEDEGNDGKSQGTSYSALHEDPYWNDPDNNDSGSTIIGGGMLDENEELGSVFGSIYGSVMLGSIVEESDELGMNRTAPPELAKLEDRIQSCDIRRQALKQECQYLNDSVARKQQEAKRSRELIKLLQSKLLEIQHRIQHEKKGLSLSETGIQLQEETLDLHQKKIAQVDQEIQELTKQRDALRQGKLQGRAARAKKTVKQQQEQQNQHNPQPTSFENANDSSGVETVLSGLNLESEKMSFSLY